MLRCLRECYLKISPDFAPRTVINAVFPRIVTTRHFSDKPEDSKNNINPDEPSFDMPNPFEKEQIQCVLCKHKIIPDYKNVRLLSQFQSPYTGRIYGRHITGLCKKQQELVEKEINKAQSVGLMPSYLKEPIFLKDPELFDVEKPLRPHRF